MGVVIVFLRNVSSSILSKKVTNSEGTYYRNAFYGQDRFDRRNLLGPRYDMSILVFKGLSGDGVMPVY